MTRKIECILIGMMACLLLTGCNQVIDLTDEQSALIAEYAGQLLLKHNLNYEDKLNEGQKEESEQEEESSSEEIATEEQSTETVTEASIKEDTGDQQEEAVQTGDLQDIARIIGLEGASITYKDYMFVDQYPEAGEDEQVVSIDASDGYELLVVRFDVTNTTEDMMDISLMDTDIQYQLVWNGSKLASPMLTILMNDLGTFDMSIKPGDDQEGVLVFQVSDTMKDALETMELKVTYNNTRNTITIK